jgi:hypothetical protein
MAMGCQRGLAGAAFLAGENDNVHFGFLPKTNQGFLLSQKARKNAIK